MEAKVERPLTWKAFEDAVFEECKRAFRFQDVEVIKDAHIVGQYSGVERQIDILIRHKRDSVPNSIIIFECKHYGTKINVKIVDSFIGCLADVGADRGIIVSEKGFTKAAINRAHKGKDDIEVDILCIGELQQFQAFAAFPYSGNCAISLSPPFGWIIDGKRRVFSPVVLYRRGISFEEAVKEKEWVYLQFWEKHSDEDTLASLIALQNEYLKDVDELADIQLVEVGGLVVRKAFLPSYPTPEITVYREFDWFIVFAVLFCPECYIERDIKKVVTMLLESIPLRVRA